MDGLIIVYDPDEEGKEPELEKWRGCPNRKCTWTHGA
jgi:hypothetical protein